MIVSIVKDKGPLSILPHVAPVVKESMPIRPALERSGSTTTESQSPAKSITASEGSPKLSPQRPLGTTFMRGFSLPQIPTPQTISSAALSLDTIAEPKASPAAKMVQSKKTAYFMLDGSCSSSEQDQSLNNSKSIIPIKKPVFQIGGSSEEDRSLKSAMASSRPSSLLCTRKNQAPFSNNVMTRIIDDEAAVDPDTDDYMDESAIDDDDYSSDWEDSMEESGQSGTDDKFFQRVDSKPNLISRRSLITLMLAQNGRAQNLSNYACQFTLAIPCSRITNDPSAGVSPKDSDEAHLMMMKDMCGPGINPVHEVPRSNAQPIITGPQHIQPQAALSPRTTRRNMLATELTESLRRHLLWERQQKSSTANAVLKRRHTSHDVTNVKQYPEKPYMKKSEDLNANSWNQNFSQKTVEGYHTRGW
ncbi:hypothetical protein Forpe1208_v015664 [Fusarium oxysporum f. sp. rapae]|uniref:DUF3295 domain-containing protein n=1 Tax=Fusarium oxysporum f. sp. rapae TaxID=485398 RepID=A0A8J5NJE0_FUSOX|nr:hypothetical protein Forpe1208_v015664 [Fusarium oxysporum f. sp. rapae]